MKSPASLKNTISRVVFLSAALLVSMAAYAPAVSADTTGCVAVNDTYALTNASPSNNAFNGTVIANDVTADYAGGLYSSVRGQAVQLPSGARFWLSQHGQFEYVPVDGFVGTEVIQYALETRPGFEVCSTATLTLDVNVPDYKRLAALPDTAATNDLTSVVSDVMANDTFVRPTYSGLPVLASVSNLTPALGTFRIIASPQNRYAKVVEFVPAQYAQGVASADYTLTDSFGSTATGRLSVAVSHQNLAPTAYGDSFSGVEDGVIAGSVTTNDVDPEGTPVIATLKTSPANGDVTVSSDGTFSYVPRADFYGSDSFTYEISDGQATSQARAYLYVSAVNDAPTTGLTVTTSKKARVFTPVNPSDKDGSIVSYSYTFGDGSSATVYSAAPVSHTYRAKGTYTVTLTVTDDQGAAATAATQVIVSK